MSNFWKSAKRWLPGVIISLAAIIFIIYKFDLQNLANAIRSANYWVLFLSLGISVIWLGVRGLVWRTLLKEKASYRDVFLTLSEGYLLNNILPFRLGELGRAFLLGRKASLGFVEVLSTIAIERILDVAFSAVILLSAVPFVIGAAGAGKIATLMGILVVVGLLTLYLLARNREWAMDLFVRISRRWPTFQERGGVLVDSFLSGLEVLTDGWLFIRVLFWMILDWGISIFQFYLLLVAFFPHPQPIWALFGLGAAAFGNAVPSMPGAIGTYDAALAGALTIVSGDPTTSLAATLVAHVFNYIVTGIIGAYALATEGETLMDVYRQLRHQEKV
jgi:glycosyltransferase 2 family protein